MSIYSNTAISGSDFHAVYRLIYTGLPLYKSSIQRMAKKSPAPRTFLITHADSATSNKIHNKLNKMCILYLLLLFSPFEQTAYYEK